MITYTLKVEALRKETPDAITLSFKQPGLKKIKYRAGQYLTLIFMINGRRYMRPYSFSSSPDIDQFLEVTVKRVPSGIVSNHICDKVEVGDIVEVFGPMGDFVLNSSILNEKTNIILWGAGSGITPLFSIAKYAIKQLNLKVTLVYGNRNFESAIFSDQIKKLQSDFPDLFSVWHFHTQNVVFNDSPYLMKGRIKPEKVLSVMQQPDDISNTVHYICGPSGLKEAVKSTLKTLGVTSENIYSEDFELVKNEKDFENIITRYIIIIKDGNRIPVEVVKGKSVLDAGLDTLIEMPYSCQTGNCSICRGKIIKGQVKQVIKKNADLDENEYQLCCTYPLSDDVEVII